MKITSFRIKNYRSIRDSGVCYLSDDNITIMVGKNESGKTAILEALEDFNFNKRIREDARPLQDANLLPEITIDFEVDEKTLKKVVKSQKAIADLKPPVHIQITKSYPQNYSYKIPDVVKENIDIKDDASSVKRDVLARDYQQMVDMYSKLSPSAIKMPELDFENACEFSEKLTEFKKAAQSSLERSGPNNVLVFDYFIKSFKEFSDRQSCEELVFSDTIEKYIPNFILFSSFDDVFPSEIPINEASGNSLIKDLNVISDLNLELIKSGSSAQKAKHKRQLNVKLTQDYKKFWEQDATNLYIDWDSDKLDFFVTENEDFFPPRMRSKGKQWHLAFFIRVLARAREQGNVILIDEPGLYLHAHAQKDILNTIEDCARSAQIVFSTHSPYFVNFNKVERVRLILRNGEEGTKISNNLYKDVDKDTLTPVITAIGLNLSNGMDINKNNNVIFEKISDYYYAIAFQELLQFKFDQNVHFIPCIESEQSVTIASLMVGWGLNFCMVLDNNSKSRKFEPRLMREFASDNVKLMKVSNNPDEEIEDLFSKEDFVKYVLNGNEFEAIGEGKPKSHLIKAKEQNYDRVLLSGLFLRNVRSGKVSISTETANNFFEFFKRLNIALF
jgi:predicted ATP-dependent endonuclease of OLD family